MRELPERLDVIKVLEASSCGVKTLMYYIVNCLFLARPLSNIPDALLFPIAFHYFFIQIAMNLRLKSDRIRELEREYDSVRVVV